MAIVRSLVFCSGCRRDGVTARAGVPVCLPVSSSGQEPAEVRWPRV